MRMKKFIQIIVSLSLIIDISATEPASLAYKSLVGKTVNFNKVVIKTFDNQGNKKTEEEFLVDLNFTFQDSSIVDENIWKIMGPWSEENENINFICSSEIDGEICTVIFMIKPYGKEILKFIAGEDEDVVIIYKIK